MTASVTYGRAARATPKAPRAASYTTTWDTAKNWRRIATRYDRLARNYLASLALVSIVIAWT